MDDTKRAIASDVQNYVLGRRFYITENEDQVEVRASKISDLKTSIRVPTAGGPRYFEVTVKEAY